MHANSWECGVGIVRYGNCTHIEYGNYFDVMGSGGASLHFNASFKDAFGWLGDSLLTITKSGTYSIDPLELDSGIHAAKIYPPFLQSAPYYLEFRKPIGFDSALSGPIYLGGPQANINGLFINWSLNQSWAPFSRLLDFNPVKASSDPNSYEDWWDVVLSNKSLIYQFTDVGTGITITPVTTSDQSKATFKVDINRPDCIRSKPSVEFLESGGKKGMVGMSGSWVWGSLIIQNLDSLFCAPGHFQTSIIAPNGWGVYISPEEPMLIEPDGGFGWSSVAIYIPANTTSGLYKATMTVKNLDTDGADYVSSITIDILVGCIRANPTISVAPSAAQSVPRGDTASYTVTVTNNDNIDCPAANFNLVAKLPAGWSASFAPTALDIAPGQTASSIFKVTIAQDAVPTSYQISISAANGADAAYFGSAKINVLALEAYKSSTDFSGTQGSKNWYYLDSNETPLTYDSVSNQWKGTQTNLLLWKDGGSPGATRAVQRQWVAPHDGTIRITGNAKDIDTGGGDGVVVKIRKNGYEDGDDLLQKIINNGNTVGYDFDLTRSVKTGDKINFIIMPRSNNKNDSTYFDPMIVYQ